MTWCLLSAERRTAPAAYETKFYVAHRQWREPGDGYAVDLP